MLKNTSSMHVHELNPKRTMVTLIIFTLIIVVGLLTIRNPRLSYSLSPEETINLVISGDGMVVPYELEDVLNGTIDTVLLWDIRNTFEFGKGHIPGAENISAVNLLESDNIDRLNELKEKGISVILYGNDQLHANGPWLVFRQLGFDHVKLLLGGYDYYSVWKDHLADTYGDDAYMLGTPDFDYALESASATSAVTTDESNKTIVTVARKKKKTVAEGGC